jgi:hypothetical protein
MLLNFKKIYRFFQLKIIALAVVFCCEEAYCQQEATVLDQTKEDSSISRKIAEKTEEIAGKAEDLKEIINSQELISELKSNSKDVADEVVQLLENENYKSIMLSKGARKNLKKAIKVSKNGSPESFTIESDEYMTEEEKKNLEQKKKDLEAKKQEESLANEKAYVYLASILFENKNNWVIWINEQKITNKNNSKKKELYVSSITKDLVKILWQMPLSKWQIISGKKKSENLPQVNAENNVEIRFALMPNQTFVLDSKSVVEGREVIDLVKKQELERKAANSTNPNEVKQEEVQEFDF